jgi:hypothetical protein
VNDLHESNQASVRVLLADDASIIRNAVSRLLESEPKLCFIEQPGRGAFIPIVFHHSWPLDTDIPSTRARDDGLLILLLDFFKRNRSEPVQVRGPFGIASRCDLRG